MLWKQHKEDYLRRIWEILVQNPCFMYLSLLKANLQVYMTGKETIILEQYLNEWNSSL